MEDLQRALQLRRAGKAAEAESAYRDILVKRPDAATTLAALMNLGGLLRETGRWVAAEEVFLQARDIAPNVAEVHFALGTTLKDQMRPAEAISCYRQALHLDPSHRRAFSNLLLNLHYLPDQDSKAIFDEHVEYGRRFTDPLRTDHAHPNVADPDRRLRIGYVSGDWHAHPVSFFMLPALMNRDRERFEVHCYADVRRRDVISDAVRRVVDGFHEINALGDDQVASLIRQHQVDILVDLAGHSGANRLGVFARKPAPVQVTYLGYPDTTGVRAIDYRITDAIADPPGQTDRFHTEELIRLDGCFLCYAPPPGNFPPSPANANPITFGSFSALAKITEPMIASWSRILHQVPESRLLIKSLSLQEPPLLERLRDQFVSHGISRDRIELLGPLPGLLDHLRAYDRISIALDTFPYNGTTTTCEAMWMGVPVITLAGQTHVQRVGATLLAAAGMSSYIARDINEYERLAVALTNDPHRLINEKTTLRERFMRSRLADVHAFVSQLESTYRRIWRRWCEGMGGRGSRRADLNPAGNSGLPGASPSHSPSTEI
jgi:protein O-GlcNAc transferase